MKADKPWYRGPCICGRGPYHKKSCSCHAMYLAKKKYEASISASKELSEKVAKILFDNEFIIVSRKYKKVRGPKGNLILDPETFQKFRELKGYFSYKNGKITYIKKKDNVTSSKIIA